MVRKVVVAGGLGFMGSDMVRFLAADHPEIDLAVIDNYSYSADVERLASLPNAAKIYRADIRDLDAMLQITNGADLVINFAAETHNDNSLQRPLDFVSANIDGVVSLLEAARANKFRLHQVSTDEVFGDMEVGSAHRFVEDSPIHPSSPYSASKAAGDALCLGWHRSFGVDVTLSNSANNFGPFQHQEKLIPRSIQLIRAGKKPKIYGDGTNVRDWINVRDHSLAVWEIATRAPAGERFIVSAHDLLSNNELVALLNSAFGNSGDYFEYVTDRPGHDRQYASSSQKLRQQLGWKPKGETIRQWLFQNATNALS